MCGPPLDAAAAPSKAHPHHQAHSVLLTQPWAATAACFVASRTAHRGAHDVRQRRGLPATAVVEKVVLRSGNARRGGKLAGHNCGAAGLAAVSRPATVPKHGRRSPSATHKVNRSDSDVPRAGGARRSCWANFRTPFEVPAACRTGSKAQHGRPTASRAQKPLLSGGAQCGAPNCGLAAAAVTGASGTRVPPSKLKPHSVGRKAGPVSRRRATDLTQPCRCPPSVVSAPRLQAPLKTHPHAIHAVSQHGPSASPARRTLHGARFRPRRPVLR